MSDSQYRLRLQRLADGLRQFGLVDRFDLASLLRRQELPSIKALSGRLRADKEFLPPGITGEFVARTLLAKLRVPDPDTAAWGTAHVRLACELDKILPGRKEAGRYHKHIFELLRAIFEGILTNPVMEQPVRQGLQRIDIVFDNRANEGFFAFLRDHKRVPCEYIPFECKNYQKDPGNPEYDQLSGRLNQQRGMAGFLVCRSIKDKKRADAHCQKRRVEKDEHILLLEDSDVGALLKRRRDGDHGGFNSILQGKLRALDF